MLLRDRPDTVMASVQTQYPIYGAIQKSEIRLLRMDRDWKGTIHDPLELSLVIFQDNNRPPYSALSYEWGSPLQSTFVLVNGQEIAIRRQSNDCCSSMILTIYVILHTSSSHLRIRLEDGLFRSLSLHKMEF